MHLYIMNDWGVRYTFFCIKYYALNFRQLFLKPVHTNVTAVSSFPDSPVRAGANVDDVPFPLFPPSIFPATGIRLPKEA